MAYNFFPAGYQPYQVAQPTNQQNSFIQWVQGESSAKSFPVAPNTSIPLWDSEANVIYVKSADASGMPTIKILDYTVRSDVPRTAEISPQSDFVTREELSDVMNEIAALKAKLEEPKKEAKKDGK